MSLVRALVGVNIGMQMSCTVANIHNVYMIVCMYNCLDLCIDHVHIIS